MRILFLFYLILFLFCMQSMGQETKDTLRVNEVTITAPHYNLVTPLKSVMPGLSELLEKNTGIFVKDYGPGMLSTPTFRGLSAAHTNVLWNGLNLNNPALAQTDLSLIPVFLFTRVKIHQGTETQLNSNGAFGGSINLESEPTFYEQSGKVVFQTSDIGIIKTGVGINWGKYRWAHKLDVYSTNASNQYRYVDNFNGPESIVKQKNASYGSKGLMYTTVFKVNEHHRLMANYWWQDAIRNIAPVVLIPFTGEKQRDYGIKSSLIYTYSREKNLINGSIMYLNDKLDYDNIIASIYSKLKATGIRGIAGFKRRMQNFVIETGANVELIQVENTGYVESKKQHLLSPYAGITWYYKQLKVNSNYKCIYHIQQAKAYSTGHLLMDYKVGDWLFSLKGARNYRIPSLNDLYWNPGGNPFLVPELSHQTDFATSTTFKFKHYQAEPKFTMFGNWVDNWILWQPGTYGFWQPFNVKQVFARGFEFAFNHAVKFDRFSVSHFTLYSYNKSTNRKVNNAWDLSLNRQLIYTPIYQVKSGLQLNHKWVNFNASYRFVSWRAVSSDNYDYLPWYQLVDVMLEKNIQLNKKHQLLVQAEVKNLLDANYQVLIWRPMPLRYFLITLVYQWKRG